MNRVKCAFLTSLSLCYEPTFSDPSEYWGKESYALYSDDMDSTCRVIFDELSLFGVKFWFGCR